MGYLFIFVLGLCFGSFANVYFYRLPRDLSLMTPNSFCPNCNSPIPWKDNLPLLSWILLKAKCRSCADPISIRYPLVELLCGILFLTISLSRRGELIPPYSLAAILFFSYLLFLAAGIDIVTYFQSGQEYGIIPDHLVWIVAIAGVAFAFFNPLLKPVLEFPFPAIDFMVIANEMKHSFGRGELIPPYPSGKEKLFLSLFGAAVAFLFLFGTRQIASRVFKKEALGLGDVKLVCALGLWLGWQGLFLTILFSSLLGSIVSISLILSKKLSRGSSVPFAPFLSFGAFLSLFFL